MSKRELKSLVSLGTLLVLSACASGPQTCQLSRIGPLSVLNDKNGSPLISVMLNGNPAVMMVDTGAENSLVTPDAVENFNLETTTRTVTTRGVGGAVRTPVISADTLKIGDAVASQVVFIEADMPSARKYGVPVAGLFGADFLSGYDVLFDLPKRQITLFRLEGCSTANLDWQEPFERLPFVEPSPVRVTLPAKLNGKSIDLMLDSGSNKTTVLMEQAREAGVRRDALEQDENLGSTGLDGTHLDAWSHRFDSLEIGPDLYRDPELIVAPLETYYALLGADFLWHMPMWISYREQAVLLFKPNTSPKAPPAENAVQAVPEGAHAVGRQ
ncbi:retropepsin-like aspartic protease [Acetobacter sp.]|uniref:retropepsin-like aspartic protease n=1 Tax=Acetobacter sp. TaxID=440 RepID=UPI0039ECF6DA